MTRIAVVQPSLRLGEVEHNLARVEQLVRDAHLEHAPEVIVLPEGLGSPNVYARVIREVPRPVDGQPLQLLCGLARELGCVISGGFLAIRGAHAYGTYALVEPDGALHLHDKDIPTAWEQHYYRGGDDDGVVSCGALGCRVGLASGWEWARSRTAARLRGARVSVVLGGMCWPSMPLNWPGPLHLWAKREDGIWQAQARELPGQVARLTGAPVAHAAHVGPIEGETPLAPGIPWRTRMLGESQVCERDGTVLARLSLQDGEGHVAADVQLAPPAPLEEIGERYWIPRMTLTTHVAWHAMNTHGAFSYRLRHARRGFPWQGWPAADLPDETPPSDAAQAPAALN